MRSRSDEVNFPKSFEIPTDSAGNPSVAAQPKPTDNALEYGRLETLSPYVFEIDVPCDECSGSGFDPGGIDPWGPEPCPMCHGAGTQRVTKNYLAEAFRIVGNPGCTMSVERAHLVAIVQHCRQVVSAAVRSPKASKRDHARTDL